MMDYKISVIIAIYNTKKYLEKCIKSVCDQTYKNLEIILVDDGSSDGSDIICDELAKKDERIRVIHKKNGGQSSARNAGLDIARGEFIGFIDSDDYIKEDMYEKLINSAIKNSADIAQIGFCSVDENENVIKEYKHGFKIYESFDEMIYNHFVDNNIMPSVCDKIFNRKVIYNLRFKEGYYYEDSMFLLETLKNANKIVNIDYIAYFYVQSQYSTQRGPYNRKHIESSIYHANFLCNFLINNKLEKYYFYGDKIACQRSIRAYKLLFNNIDNISSNDKRKYKDIIINMFMKHYKNLKATENFRNSRLSIKFIFAIFNINCNIYIFMKNMFKE